VQFSHIPIKNIDMNVEHLSSAELRQLKMRIERLLQAREKQDRAAAIEEIYAIAHRLGMPLRDLMEGTGRGKVGKVAVQYRNPNDPSQQWTGRGRQPKWVKDWLNAGNALVALRA
jgi:DNA-binding protein H-NS